MDAREKWWTGKRFIVAAGLQTIRSLSVVEGSAVEGSLFTINGCFDFAQQPLFGYVKQPYSRSLSVVEGSAVQWERKGTR